MKSVWEKFPHLEDELKLHHAAGDSMTQIAKRLGHGISRNAVIGKANRIGLAPRLHPIQAARQVKPKARPKPKKQPPSSKQQIGDIQPLTLADGSYITMLNAPKAPFCRYPFDHAEEFVYCGRPIKRGNYCADHAVLCLQDKSA